jgi:membrane protein involved in colicin uptake
MSEDVAVGAEDTSGSVESGASEVADDFTPPPASSNWWKFDSKDTAEEWANNLVTKRLARERKKYDPILEEHGKLKAEVEELRPLKSATQTDAERWEAERLQFSKELDELKAFRESRERDDLVRDLAEEKGLPPRFASRIKGTDAEAIAADIDDLLNVLSVEDGRATKKKPASLKPKSTEDDDSPSGRGYSGAGGGDDDEEITADVVMKRLQERGLGRGGRNPFSLRGN